MGSEIRLGPRRPWSKAPGLEAVSPHRSEPQWAGKGPPRAFTLTHVRVPSGTNFPPWLGQHLGNCSPTRPLLHWNRGLSGVSQGREQRGEGRLGRGWCLGVGQVAH